jgi:hypothetical protein
MARAIRCKLTENYNVVLTSKDRKSSWLYLVTEVYLKSGRASLQQNAFNADFTNIGQISLICNIN